MGRKAKGPVWYASRQSFYVTINGRRINLGPDKTKAEIKFHDLMGETKASPHREIELDDGLYTVAALFEVYLRHVAKNRAPSTYKAKRAYLNQFLRENPECSVRLAEKLLPIHLTDWVNSHDTWGSSYRHTLISAIQTAYNWAVNQKLIAVNNLARMEKPAFQSSKGYLDPAKYKTLLDAIDKDDPFRDFIEFLWETGCRPTEAFRLRVEHIQPDKKSAVMEKFKAKGPKIRVITLNKAAEEIISRQGRKEGAIFRNKLGNAWTKHSVNSRFFRLNKKTGIKVNAYQFRHGFATDLLTSQVDVATVSALMGHRSTRTVSETYSHLIDKQDYLREALGRRKPK